MAKRTGRIGWLAAAALVAACQVNVHTTASPKATASVKAAATATAAPTATPRAAGTATPIPAPTLAPGTRLAKPTGDFTTLVGHIAIDASYVIANNAGSLIANNSGGVLAAGAVKPDTGGGLIANNGGGLISDSGGNIVANNGGGLVSDHGVGLVSDHGVGLIGKTKRRLLAADTPAYGTVLPAAGVELDVRDLETGQLLPIGTDSAGKPVYSVYTNINGGYTIYPATGDARNVLVEAQVPGTDDPRQQLALVAPTNAEGTLDEDTTLSSREIQEILAGRLQQFMVGNSAGLLCLVGGSQRLSEASRALLTSALQDLHDSAAAAGMTNDPAMAAAVRAVAWRCSQAVIARTDLAQIGMGDGSVHWGDNPGEKPESALQAITEVFQDARVAATPKLAANPSFFEGLPYFQYANSCDPGRYQIKKPSDVNAFIIDEYLVDGSDPGLHWTGTLLDSVGALVDASGVENRSKLNVALEVVASSLATVTFGNQHGELDEVHRLIAAFDPKAPIDPSIPSALPSSCPRPLYSAGLTAECFGNDATGAATVAP